MIEHLQSAVGALVILGIAYAWGPRALRRHINWHTVLWGCVLLLAFAFVVLKTPASIVFSYANDAVERLLEFSREGAQFVFGDLARSEGPAAFVFAFQILPTIIFFAALMGILYYIGVMPFVIRQCGRFLARTLHVSGAESFSTVADIFVGQTEAPLVISPYINRLTNSELNACMVAGFATTSGGVLAAYVAMLSPYVPGIAGHLIACSVMSAPAAIVVAKLMFPESETPQTLGDTSMTVPKSGTNVLDAVASGTTDGLKLAVNVAAMLISFLALTAVINFALHRAGGWFGLDLTLERLFGWVFSPLAFVLGVPLEDVAKVGSLLGQKTVLNEFVAYTRMSRELATDPNWLSPRSRLIASYALCGFANFGSIGIQIGGYSGLAPDRRSDIARLAFRAMVGGLLATCLVACVAGLLI